MQPRTFISFDTVYSDAVVNKYEKGSNYTHFLTADTLDTSQYYHFPHLGGYNYEIDPNYDWIIVISGSNKRYEIKDFRFESAEGNDREEGCSRPVFYSLNSKPQEIGQQTSLTADTPPALIHLEP